jgi:hypothetical protein
LVVRINCSGENIEMACPQPLYTGSCDFVMVLAMAVICCKPALTSVSGGNHFACHSLAGLVMVVIQLEVVTDRLCPVIITQWNHRDKPGQKHGS